MMKVVHVQYPGYYKMLDGFLLLCPECKAEFEAGCSLNVGRIPASPEAAEATRRCAFCGACDFPCAAVV